MRNSLFFLLLATVSVPALAAPDDANDRAARREAARAERAEARSERQVEKSQPAARPEPQAQARSVEPNAVNRPAFSEQQRAVIQQRVIDRRSDRSLGSAAPRPTLEQRRETADSVRNWRQQEREQLRANGPKAVVPPAGSLRESLRERRAQRIEARDAIGNRRAPVISRVPREGTQPSLPTAARPTSLTASHWNSGWRSNHRYDWKNHRRHHRSLFHFGFYYDPFGWGYRPYSIGWRLWPSYYQSSYWLNDPWMYRLPYAPPGYRWIRYYDDALLIDTWDGQVVDVIYDFFW